MKYADWLQKEYGFKVRDFDRTKRPWFWRKFTGMKAITVKGNRVYVRDLEKTSESRLNNLLDHEVEHVEQEQEEGWRRFLVSYGLIRTYRMKKEVAAYTNSMEAAYLDGRNIGLYPATYARRLQERYRIGKRRTKKAYRLLENARRDIVSGKITKVRDRRRRWRDEY